MFCRYHKYNDHDTESCVALRKVVKRLINEGKLDQYLSTRPNPDQPVNWQINTISGVAPIADTSNWSINVVQHPQVLSIAGRHNDKIRQIDWEPITFSEKRKKALFFHIPVP